MHDRLAKYCYEILVPVTWTENSGRVSWALPAVISSHTCLTCDDCVSAVDDPAQYTPVTVRGSSSKGYDVEYTTRTPGSIVQSSHIARYATRAQETCNRNLHKKLA